MAWKDVQARIRGLLSGRGGEASSRRPDGGTSCFRPVQRRDRREEELAREKAAEYAAAQPQIPYAHTGFTGMNPPMTGRAPVQSTFAGDPYGYGAAQAAQQGFRGNGQMEVPSGYVPAFQEQPPADNISYMPGVFAPDAGNSFTHVEHIMAITSLQSCYEAIECMKNGETLVVTLDVLGSEGESLRCQDMLAGAAFTLHCTVRNLASVGVVVIAPPGVKILPEQQVRRYEAPESYVPQVQPYGEESYPPRRERRMSQNAMGWENAAQAGNQGVNPYTGSMPAAAGAYGAFGGY
ncbi:MAG: cell division protein SepF [Clostridia bacterium]|nr:cell division protein SepF [Clostridia bacterium]